MVKKEMEVTYKDEYKQLKCYVQELLNMNLGSTVVLDVLPSADLLVFVFNKLYICFDTCKKRCLAGCRPVFGVDGYFINGLVKWELLVAVGRDAND